MGGVYYNEFDKFAAAWLRELIKAGLIPDGEVDEGSIVDVQPGELRSFRQCHFFAGIGGWPHALDLAGWPRDKEVWTGSCPCQPFSVAGQQKADNDERDLWPAFFNLISERGPSAVFGEQVGGTLGYQWLAGVRFQLEGCGYRVGAANLPACAVRAPHRRQRIYWGGVADSESIRSGWRSDNEDQGRRQLASADSGNGGVDDANGTGHRGREDARGEWFADQRERERGSESGGFGGVVHSAVLKNYGQRNYERNLAEEQIESRGTGFSLLMGNTECARLEGCERSSDMELQGGAGAQRPTRPASFWDDAEWRVSADGKARRVKPGVRLLVDGFSNRVGLLRGFGNAIVPQVAQAFIEEMMEIS